MPSTSHDEKVQQIEQLKMYMKEHVDEDDFSVLLEENHSI